MKTFTVKLTNPNPNGIASIKLTIRASSRAAAQDVALKQYPDYRLHDNEPKPTTLPRVATGLLLITSLLVTGCGIGPGESSLVQTGRFTVEAQG